MRRQELKKKFSQTVGQTKAEEILTEAETVIGLEGSGSYSNHTVRDLAEYIEIEYDGYISEIANEVRVQTQAKQRFDTLLENVPSPVVIVAFEENQIVVRTVNDAFVSTFGYEAQDVFGANLGSLIVAEGEELDQNIWFQQGRDREREVTRTTATGERRTFLRRTAVATRPDGKIEGYGIYTDITDRKERERVLKTQRDNLNILNQVVRHDIRNNIQVVLSYAHLLEDYVEESGQEYVEQVVEVANEAVDITQTAREVTEMTLKTDVDHFSLPLKKILRESVEEIKSSHEQSTIVVEGQIPAVEVLADNMLNSVFRNLLKNAVLHNDKEVPIVTVSALVTDDTVRVEVADNGLGISDDRKEQIFEKGEQGLDSEGTGLGLYLVQTLVDRYGGVVWVEDNDPEGSVFVVELPIAE